MKIRNMTAVSFCDTVSTPFRLGGGNYEENPILTRKLFFVISDFRYVAYIILNARLVKPNSSKEYVPAYVNDLVDRYGSTQGFLLAIDYNLSRRDILLPVFSLLAKPSDGHGNG